MKDSNGFIYTHDGIQKTTSQVLKQVKNIFNKWQAFSNYITICYLHQGKQNSSQYTKIMAIYVYQYDYQAKMGELLDDPAYRNSFPTGRVERQVNLLVKTVSLSLQVLKPAVPCSFQPPELWGFPKILNQGYLCAPLSAL